MSHEQLEIISAAFRRLRLVGQEEALPTPFHSIYGEAEQAAAFFFEIRGQIVAAKLPEDPASLQYLWNEVREFRARGEHLALLPLAGNEESDRVLVYHDGRWIAQALRRLGLFAVGARVPRPRRVISGLAGYSRLYLIQLTGVMDVLAKFDRPDRLRHEAHATDAIRQSGRILSEATNSGEFAGRGRDLYHSDISEQNRRARSDAAKRVSGESASDEQGACRRRARNSREVPSRSLLRCL
jgi:hypothetical protein